MSNNWLQNDDPTFHYNGQWFKFSAHQDYTSKKLQRLIKTSKQKKSGYITNVTVCLQTTSKDYKRLVKTLIKWRTLSQRSWSVFSFCRVPLLYHLLRQTVNCFLRSVCTAKQLKMHQHKKNTALVFLKPTFSQETIEKDKQNTTR